MKINAKELLLAIESPSNLSRLIEKVDSNEKVLEFKGLLQKVLFSKSTEWSRLEAEGLERMLKTITDIKNKIAKLLLYHQEIINYIEDDRYEIIGPPYNWDFFLPEGSSEELKMKFKRDYDEKVENDIKYAEYMRQNKNSVLLGLYKYMQILNRWDSDTDNQLKELTLMMHESTIGSKSVTIRSVKSYRDCLKPFEGKKYDVFSGIPALRAGLITLEVIDPDTKITDLRRIFGFGSVESVINWKGYPNSLYHFVKQLEIQGKINPLKRTKSVVISNLFKISRFPNFDFSEFRHYNGPYAKISQLKKLISNL